MANTLFAKGREAFLTGKVDWLGDTIRAALCDAVPDVDKDGVLADVKSFAVSPPLKGKTADGGVAGASSLVFQQVDGKKPQALVLFKDSGDPKTSVLLLLVDTPRNGGFPEAPAGTDIQINWATTPERIFRL
jgi:hypothetical protein